MIVYAITDRCTLCHKPADLRAAIDRALWNDDGSRATTRHVAVVRDLLGAKSSTAVENLTRRHMLHVEREHREATASRPARDNEVAIGHDFHSVTDLGARIGVKAMAVLGERLEAPAGVSTKEVTQIAKLGVAAATVREASRLKGNDQKLTLFALFADASGHARIPDTHSGGEETVDLADLRDELDDERRLLTAHALNG